MTVAQLKSMVYLKACLKESQRMAGSAFATARMTQVDMVLGGYEVPRGTLVLRHGAIPANSTSFFDQPETFRPQRWIRGSAESKRVDAYASLPFGHGPRACVGQRFARLELYMMVVKILQKYRVEYSGPPLQLDYIGMTKPDGPVHLKMNLRTK